MSDTVSDWRPVPGFEGYYEVSSRGEFRSLDRWVDFADGRRRFYAGRHLRLKVNRDGYPLVLLSAGMSRKNWHLAHRIVAHVFIGECPPGQETCHRDGIPGRITAENLYYGTRAQNAADRMIHGTALFGAEHPSSHVSDVQANAIRVAAGTISEIATSFGVSRTHAWNIRAGKRRHSLSEMLS